MKPKLLLRPATFCLVFLFLLGTNFSAEAQEKAISGLGDANLSIPVPYDFKSNKEYSKKIRKHSQYVKMDDGVKLAVDVYFPAFTFPGEKLPVILYQTRYWRSIELRWPFKLFSHIVPSTSNYNPLEFVRNGYILVTVDVRGSGASFGNKEQSLPDEREIRDGANIVDWIVSQSWSNGVVGATGISYIGNAALYLLFNQHPAVKAVAPMYSVFDIYDDIALPGGIYFQNFIAEWNEYCNTLDNNQLPEGRRDLLTRMAVRGVGIVKSAGKVFYKEAVAFHDCNVYMVDEGYSPEFMDDEISKNGLVVIEDLRTPHFRINEVNNSGAAIYSYSGWWDGALQHAAIKQFLNFTNPSNKLIIGPWNHAGTQNISPFNGGPSQFGHINEVMKFFDHHLSGKATTLESEPRVHYYTIGAEKWQASLTWPPENTTSSRLFLTSDLGLTETSSQTSERISFNHDSKTGSGDFSRWNFSVSSMKVNPGLADSIDRLTLSFTSEPLTHDLEVTGHPIVHLQMAASAEDAAIFAYLEEQTEDGRILRITEGQLRLIHRKIYDEPVWYNDVVPFRSYSKKDAMPVLPGEIMEVKFDLLPVSWMLKKGSSLRVSLAGGDRDYFKSITPDGTQFEFLTGPDNGCFIELPVVQHTGRASMESF